jgi:hypothetical protein
MGGEGMKQSKKMGLPRTHDERKEEFLALQHKAIVLGKPEYAVFLEEMSLRYSYEFAMFLLRSVAAI